MKREEAKQLAADALNELQEALQQGKSDTLLRYLDTMSRFHSYSWGNTLMIAVQMTVTQCDTFQGLRFERQFLLIG